MRVLVTGSTGLVGNNLTRMLCDAGYQVRCLVRSRDKAERLLGGLAIDIVEGDMRDVSGFADAIDGCEVVFHTAAYFREYYQPGKHADSLEAINIRGAIELLTTAEKRGVRRFVHVSSGGAVGMKPDGSPGDEDTPPLPEQRTNLYFKSKIDSDEMIRAWIDAHSMEVIEILPGWIWGPGDAGPTNAGQLALQFVRKEIPVVPPGGTCIVDARDVAAAMITAVDRARPGQKYIVGGEYHSMQEVFAGLEQASGVRAPRMKLPFAVLMTYAWFDEQWSRLTGSPVKAPRHGLRLMRAEGKLSSAKAIRELGATFRPLADTLRDVVAWYRDNGLLPASQPG